MIDEKIKQVIDEAFQTYVEARKEKDEDYRAFLRGRLSGMKRLLKAMGIEFKYSFKCKCNPDKMSFLNAPCPCPSYTLKEMKEGAPC